MLLLHGHQLTAVYFIAALNVINKILLFHVICISNKRGHAYNSRNRNIVSASPLTELRQIAFQILLQTFSSFSGNLHRKGTVKGMGSLHINIGILHAIASHIACDHRSLFQIQNLMADTTGHILIAHGCGNIFKAAVIPGNGLLHSAIFKEHIASSISLLK